MAKSSSDEAAFQSWYQKHAKKLGISPNPDDPRHHYDYRAAFRAGEGPDSTGHWPSSHKTEGHPRMVINGINTKTGKPVASAAERGKLRAGLRQRLGRPTPAEAGRLPNPPDSTPLKRVVRKVKDVAGRIEQRGNNVSSALSEGARKIKRHVGRG